MKTKYIVLLSCLRKNAKMKLKKMSQLTGIPVTTIHDQLKKSNPIINRHTVLFNFEELGYFARAYFVVAVEKDDREHLREFLEKSSHVNSLYKVNNNFDFLAELVFKKIKDAEDFIAVLEKNFRIREKEVHYILEDVKREAFMANPELTMAFGNQQSP